MSHSRKFLIVFAALVGVAGLAWIASQRRPAPAAVAPAPAPPERGFVPQELARLAPARRRAVANPSKTDGKTAAASSQTAPKLRLADFGLVDADESGTYEAMLARLANPQAELDEIQRWLIVLYTKERPSDIGDESWFSLKNEILSFLRNQEPPVPGMTQILLGLYYDPEFDPVTRDYALQHASVWYDKAPDRGEIAFAFRRALEEREASIAGTALLALSRLSERYPEFSNALVRNFAHQLLEDPDCGESARISAVQVAAESKALELVPLLVSSLNKKENSIPVTIATLAALADLMGENARPILDQFAGSEQAAVQFAAKAGLRRIQENKNL